MLTLASGLANPDDILYDFERNLIFVGEHGSGRVAVLSGTVVDRLQIAVPQIEGIVRIGENYYFGDQTNDRLVRTSGGRLGNPIPFLQLQPLRGIDGLDNMRSAGATILVPDSARGTLLVVDESGTIIRRIAGFSRPVDAFALPDGSILVADENAGGVWRVLPDDSKSLIATGLPLADDVVADPAGRVFTITINSGRLLEVGAGGSPAGVATGFRQPQGLEVDHAGNLLVTDFETGRLLLVVMSFKLPPSPAVISLQAGQAICISPIRAPDFAGPITPSQGHGYTVAGADRVVPDHCAEAECAVQLTVTSGSLQDRVRIRYSGG